MRRAFITLFSGSALAWSLAALAQPLMRLTRQATGMIPIVMAAAGDPIREGLVQSLARPGGNLTGLTILVQGRIEPKQLELLKQAVPGLTRVGVLANRSGDPAVAEEISAAARTLGLQLQTFEVSVPQDISGAFLAMTQAGVGAVLVRADPFVLDPQSAQSVTLALRHRLPAIYPWPTIPALGGLMSFNTSIRELHRRAAFYVDRILKGDKPGDLPIEQPTKFDLVVNLETAKALRLNIPETLLQRADQLIE